MDLQPLPLLRGFDKAHPPGACGEQQRAQRQRGGVMRHVGLTDWPAQERLEVAAGHIQLHRHRLVLDERTNAAQQIEALLQCRPDFRPVRPARGYCHLWRRRGELASPVWPGPAAVSAASSWVRAHSDASGAPAASASPFWMKARRVKVFVLIIPVKDNLGYYLLIPQNSLPVKSDPASEPGGMHRVTPAFLDSPE